MGIFNSLVYATKELMPTILIISVITSMSGILMDSGINNEIVSPFKGLIKNYTEVLFYGRLKIKSIKTKFEVGVII